MQKIVAKEICIGKSRHEKMMYKGVTQPKFHKEFPLISKKEKR